MLPGDPLEPYGRIVNSVLLFEHFTTNQIKEENVKWTNFEIAVKRQNDAQQTITHNDTCQEEIRFIIGILVLLAALENKHLTLNELFNTEYSGRKFVSCMS